MVDGVSQPEHTQTHTHTHTPSPCDLVFLETWWMGSKEKYLKRRRAGGSCISFYDLAFEVT